jgi:type I restriction enzyme S subunit
MFCKETEFQDTPIGKMPKSWNVYDANYVTDFIKDGTHTPPKRVEKGIPLFSAKNIAKGKIVLSDEDTFITETDYKKIHAKYEIQKNDVLLTIVGTIGHSAVADVNYRFSLQRSVAIFRPNLQRIQPHFLHYVFESKAFRRQLLGHTKLTTQGGIYLKELSQLKVPVPALSEQRIVVGVLGVVDSAIELADKVIAKAERLKKGLMQKLLTEGIGHTEYKETPIGKTPKTWQTAKLEDVLELCQYGLSAKFGETGKYRILKMDDIASGIAIPDNAKYIDLNKKTFDNFKLEKGDILFNRTNSYELVGRTGIFLLDGDYTFASYLIRLRPKKETADSQFLTYYLVFSNNRLKQLATRAVHQANINATNLQSFTIALPPLPEQKQIAETLVTLDRRLELERKEKAKLERVKRGLMDLLLTGKVRVRMD